MLTLVIRHRDSVPIEAECVCPDRLMPMALADIERLRVWHGNRQTALADHFDVSGDGRDGSRATARGSNLSDMACSRGLCW